MILRRVFAALLGLMLALGVQAQLPFFWDGKAPAAGSFEPIPGLGDLTNGLYMDWSLGSLTPTKGPTFSITRATATTSIDLNDEVVNISSGQPRWHRIGAGSGNTGILVYDAHTNLVLQSEDFSTTWAAVDSPTRTAANVSCGVVALDLIGDDSAIALEGYTQTVTFTGNTIKAVSMFVDRGTSTSTVIRLRDTTAPANRLLAELTWSGETPSLVMTTGTFEGSDDLAGNVWRLRFQTTSVTAANTNSLGVYPATDAGSLSILATGNINVGGVMANNAVGNSPYFHISFPYIKTTTATVTVNADAITADGTGVIGGEGTLWAEARGPIGAGVHLLVAAHDGTANDAAYPYSFPATAYYVTDGGAAQWDYAIGSVWTTGVLAKQALAYKANDFQGAFNGTATTADTSGTAPTMNTFQIGRALSSGMSWNGLITRTAYSTTRASSANLATATAP